MQQTELTVIVPTADNQGRTLQPVIQDWEAFLLSTVGGFSKYPGSGQWVDNGTVYRDEHYRYVMSGNVKPVQDSLPRWAQELRQIELMSITRRVTVNFVAGVAAVAA